jgi:predicted NACHT family NTPase
VYVLERASRLAGRRAIDLKVKIDDLKSQLSHQDNCEMLTWRNKQGEVWLKQFHSVIVEYRNIGHDWQFTDTQKAKLQQYYDANKLLVDCLNSDCYVTKATRHYLEETLLLPMSEIEKKNAEYGIESLER